ncbi:helix-turn-helix domain-containing protein [Virgibacillus siamensis]|uniref:helix-turn-helix domain-containing protein n=1 Tax=Virgibacillus siamensis TaxID=480071 RepID=UPI00098607AB|nr:helix-turn-helix transcriptional regulator [Virgibacillus siamensis]
MSGNYPEIDEVISFIHQNLYEPISLSGLAREAAYSPYHFTRIFKERTGLTPQYYVASVRLQKAKDLLINTNLSVRDIGMEIGQQSLGTFTTRFTKRVGLSPSQFRHSRQQAGEDFFALKQLNKSRLLLHDVQRKVEVKGIIRGEAPFDGFVLIGLFPKPIPEGMPLYGTLLFSLGNFSFSNVKPGTYYLMATSVTWDMQPIDFLLPHRTLRYKANGPLIVKPNLPVPFLDITLRSPRLDDPPILISLPRLMNNFLQRTNQ